MRRRTFLRSTVTMGFALSIAPFVPRPAPPSTSDGDCADRVPSPSIRGEATLRQAWRLAQLAQAWRQAAVAGKPLLLIVVPDEQGEQACQANAWGEAISHGSDDFIATLDTAVLATATQAEIASYLPDYARQDPAPSMVRIDVCGLPATWEARRVAAIYAHGWADDDEYIDDRIAAIDAACRTLLPAGEGTATAAARRAVIPGARWGASHGCGVEYETEDPLIPATGWGVDCGMGHVNPRSVRFLDFLTQEPPEASDD